MDDDDYNEQQREVSIYTPPGNLDRGALAHAFMTVNNQDGTVDNQDGEGNVIPFSSRQPSRKKSQDPSTALQDLRLPIELFKIIAGIQGFAEMNHHKEIQSPLGMHLCTYLPPKDQRDARYFIYVPAWIIENFNPANASAIAALGMVFKPKSFLMVVHSGSPDIELRQIIENGWDRYSKCKLLSRENIQSLQQREPARRKYLMNSILDFKDS